MKGKTYWKKEKKVEGAAVGVFRRERPDIIRRLRRKEERKVKNDCVKDSVGGRKQTNGVRKKKKKKIVTDIRAER